MSYAGTCVENVFCCVICKMLFFLLSTLFLLFCLLSACCVFFSLVDTCFFACDMEVVFRIHASVFLYSCMGVVFVSHACTVSLFRMQVVFCSYTCFFFVGMLFGFRMQVPYLFVSYAGLLLFFICMYFFLSAGNVICRMHVFYISFTCTVGFVCMCVFSFAYGVLFRMRVRFFMQFFLLCVFFVFHMYICVLCHQRVRCVYVCICIVSHVDGFLFRLQVYVFFFIISRLHLSRKKRITEIIIYTITGAQ